jgi:Cu2+-exporting ATPase
VDAPKKLQVLGEPRVFCCHGCREVSKAIIESGLEDYYRNRDGHSATGGGGDFEQLLAQFSIYDNEKVQKAFVQNRADSQEAYLILEGIRCSACVWLNELHLRRQPGVLDVHIDEVSQRARVVWNPDQIKLSQILASIQLIGYQAHPYEPTHYQQLQKENQRKNFQRLIFAGFIGMIPMHFSLATWFIGGPDAQGELANWEWLGRWTSLFVTLTILVYPAQEFFYGVWSDIRRRVIGMDVPIVLGLSAVFLQSAYSTVTASGEVYFESIAMFVLFILISRRLEHQARIHASDQLERLAMAQPQEARKILPSGQIVTISIKEVESGDLLQIVPGDRVPVDCEIVEGESSFDESLLTGESAPVLHGPGDRIVSGSVNYDQPVTACSLHNEMDSTIMEISRLAEAGLRQKPAEALFADRVAARFVVVILLLAAATAFYWWWQGDNDWPIYAVSVLIVTCPCALALAAPIALTISSSVALARGLLILDMSALQRLSKVDTFAFDKTGTLTEGRLQLVSERWSSEFDQILSRKVLQALVLSSEHPVARALKREGVQAIKPGHQVRNRVGEGLALDHQGQHWFLGRCQGEADGSEVSDNRLLANRACLTCDGGVVAVFEFSDTLRPSVTRTVKHLQEFGVDTAILSGDHRVAVAQVASVAGISHFQAGLLPQEKMDWVRQKQSQGHRVAMMGDGINDAPTLAVTDVSFSLAESTGLANAHSNILLLGNDLDTVPDAFYLATNAMRKIRQNFAWAIGYNLVALPFAMAGMVPPWLAALGMSVSSVIVVYNSMRLKRQIQK